MYGSATSFLLIFNVKNDLVKVSCKSDARKRQNQVTSPYFDQLSERCQPLDNILIILLININLSRPMSLTSIPYFSFPHRKSQKWLKKSQYVVNISNTCNLINKDPNQQIFNMVFNAAGPPHSPPRALWTGSRPLQGRNPLSIPQHQVLHIVPTAKTSAHQTCM